MFKPHFAALLLIALCARAEEKTPGNIENAARATVGITITPKQDGWEKSLTGTSGDFESFLNRKKSITLSGFLIAPDRVLIRDPMLEPGEIAEINVSAGTQSVKASVEAFLIDSDGARLALAAPLTSAQAAPPAPGAAPAAALFTQKRGDDEQIFVSTKPFDAAKRLFADGIWRIDFSSPTQIQRADGSIFGYAAQSSLPLSALTPERADPARWPGFTPQALETRQGELLTLARQHILPVTFTFRPPKDEKEDRYSYRYRGSSESGKIPEDATEGSLTGMLLTDTRMIVPYAFPRKQLARLEGINVLIGGKTVKATYVATLTAFEGTVLELTEAHPEAVLPIETDPPADLHALHFLVAVDGITTGDYRARIHRTRIDSLSRSWRNTLTPSISGVSDRKGLIFSNAGRCRWVSVEVKEKRDTFGRSYNWNSSNSITIPAATFASFAHPADADINPAIQPLAKEDEQRLGWIGIDLQPLDRALAEANNVTIPTRSGSFGGIVSLVYPGSPAEQAGVEPGWVLTRLLPSGQTLPSELSVEKSESYMREFPWEQLDEIPAQYFDRLPAPWPTFNTPFRAQLTDSLGIGASFTAEFFVNGTRELKALTVAAAPAWFGNARTFNWKRAGIETADLTLDVREYLNLDAEAPGVVIKRIRQGGVAAQAGVKPYELIVKVEGQPVADVAAFEKAIEGKSNVKLTLSRMAKERVVSITPASEDPAPEAEKNGADE